MGHSGWTSLCQRQKILHSDQDIWRALELKEYDCGLCHEPRTHENLSGLLSIQHAEF